MYWFERGPNEGKPSIIDWLLWLGIFGLIFVAMVWDIVQRSARGW